MKPTHVKFVKMFELDGGGFPSLTVGNVYEVEEDVDASSSTEFHIIDDNGNQHWFDDFGKSTDDFKTEDYFEIVD